MDDPNTNESSMPRRKFLQLSAASVGAAGTVGVSTANAAEPAPERRTRGNRGGRRTYNAPYSGAYLNRVAFPLGGIGAGMICLTGSGGFTNVSLRHHNEIPGRKWIRTEAGIGYRLIVDA